MSSCRETLRGYKRTYRMLAKRFLRLRCLRRRTVRPEKASRGSSGRKPRGNQPQRLSRGRPQGNQMHHLPLQRHRRQDSPSSRLVPLCQCQRLLKHLRPPVNRCADSRNIHSLGDYCQLGEPARLTSSARLAAFCLAAPKKIPRAVDARGYKLLPQPEALFDLDGVFSGGAGGTSAFRP
jgi:hypothetical protein